MATFVLIHGAWHGGWCWKRVATLLREASHEMYTPTLTGLGERAHLMHLMNETIDLSTHIQDVIGVLHWEELSDVVLCGHSYGGMVISGVADRVPERLRMLVYLDAFVPEDGQCMIDFLPPDIAAHFRDEAKTKGKGFRIPRPPAEEFSNIVNAQDQAAESGKRDYSRPLLSEPDVKVSLHSAQASQRPCEGPVSTSKTCWLHDTERWSIP